MAKFCGRCGEELNNGLCPKCGCSYPVSYEPYLLLKCKNDVMNRICVHIIVNCIIWLCIGILQIFTHRYQIIIGGVLVHYYLIGVWNIIVCMFGIFNSYNMKSDTEFFVRKWDKSIVSILIFGIINLMIGSFIGFVLNLHMLYIRHIIIKNKMLLCSKGGI